jgi:hypothetical protein
MPFASIVAGETNVFTELFPSNGYCAVARLHSCYLVMGLRVTILSSHLCLSLFGLFPSGFQLKLFTNFLPYVLNSLPILPPFRFYHANNILVKSTNYESPHYANLSFFVTSTGLGKNIQHEYARLIYRVIHSEQIPNE